jgi:hypothetical protein
MYCSISYEVDSGRQAIVDSWPANIDDFAARRDWGWQPSFDRYETFSDYLVPAVKLHYERKVGLTAKPDPAK